MSRLDIKRGILSFVSVAPVVFFDSFVQEMAVVRGLDRPSLPSFAKGPGHAPP